MDEEEYEKDGVGSGEGDARDHVDGLRDADRVRRFFFANLDETWLKEINLQMNDDTESRLWVIISRMTLHYMWLYYNIANMKLLLQIYFFSDINRNLIHPYSKNIYKNTFLYHLIVTNNICSMTWKFTSTFQVGHVTW